MGSRAHFLVSVALTFAPACERSAAQQARVPAWQLGSDDGDHVQPSLATATDARGGLWIVAGYTDQSEPGRESAMGLSIRSPDGFWQTYASLMPASGHLEPSGDAWLASAQHGARVYYVSLTNDRDDPPNGVGEGIALATIDVGEGTPSITPPQRIDGDEWEGWDEPTIAATRPPGASDETVIVAATPIDVDVQDAIAVFTSNDGGRSFASSAFVYAPMYPGRVAYGPDNTVVRPVLQQDPRPGEECHEFLAFAVHYATAIANTRGVRAPACATDPAGCRSIAESESFDCGQRWSAPRFIVVDTGRPVAPDYRGFSYAVANDGTRAVIYANEADGHARVSIKRASVGSPFEVIARIDGVVSWSDGGVETLAEDDAEDDSVRLWRPTLAGGSNFAAFWVEEQLVTHQSTVRYRLSEPGSNGAWTVAQSVDPWTDGIACDALPNPLDNYMGAVAEAPFGAPARSYLLAWTAFAPCDSAAPHHILVDRVP